MPVKQVVFLNPDICFHICYITGLLDNVNESGWHQNSHMETSLLTLVGVGLGGAHALEILWEQTAVELLDERPLSYSSSFPSVCSGFTSLPRLRLFNAPSLRVSSGHSGE